MIIHQCGNKAGYVMGRQGIKGNLMRFQVSEKQTYSGSTITVGDFIIPAPPAFKDKSIKCGPKRGWHLVDLSVQESMMDEQVHTQQRP